MAIFLENSEHFEVVDWANEPAKKRVACDGEERGTAEHGAGAPSSSPKNVWAASLYAPDVACGQVRSGAPRKVWENLVAYLWEFGLVEPTAIDEVFAVDAQETVKKVVLKSGKLRATNSFQRAIGADMDQLSLSVQWSSTSLLAHELILWTSVDRKSLFHRSLLLEALYDVRTTRGWPCGRAEAGH